MRNLQFKSAKAENFLCFENIEIKFEQHGPITLITAQNLDSSTEDKIEKLNQNVIIFHFLIHEVCLFPYLLYKNCFHLLAVNHSYNHPFYCTLPLVRLFDYFNSRNLS